MDSRLRSLIIFHYADKQTIHLHEKQRESVIRDLYTKINKRNYNIYDCSFVNRNKGTANPIFLNVFSI